MHKNARFNILQAPGNCNPLFVVIDGQRTASGQMEHGAKVLTASMPRDEAIAEADRLQQEADSAGLAMLKNLYVHYNAMLKAKGVRLVAYTVPCCGATLETRAAPEDERWDTLSTCPECGKLHMKITEGASAHGLAVGEEA